MNYIENHRGIFVSPDPRDPSRIIADNEDIEDLVYADGGRKLGLLTLTFLLLIISITATCVCRNPIGDFFTNHTWSILGYTALTSLALGSLVGAYLLKTDKEEGETLSWSAIGKGVLTGVSLAGATALTTMFHSILGDPQGLILPGALIGASALIYGLYRFNVYNNTKTQELIIKIEKKQQEAILALNEIRKKNPQLNNKEIFIEYNRCIKQQISNNKEIKNMSSSVNNNSPVPVSHGETANKGFCLDRDIGKLVLGVLIAAIGVAATYHFAGASIKEFFQQHGFSILAYSVVAVTALGVLGLLGYATKKLYDAKKNPLTEEEKYAPIGVGRGLGYIAATIFVVGAAFAAYYLPTHSGWFQNSVEPLFKDAFGSIGAGVIALPLIAYGGSKLHKYVQERRAMRPIEENNVDSPQLVKKKQNSKGQENPPIPPKPSREQIQANNLGNQLKMSLERNDADSANNTQNVNHSQSNEFDSSTVQTPSSPLITITIGNAL